MNITSAAGVISLLDEPEPQLKVFALEKLNRIVNVFWAEISEAIGKIEILYEDVAFKNSELAALVASKVYYHLGAFDDSLTYALGAGNLFNVNDTTEYVETIIAKCIDHYTKLRVANIDVGEGEQVMIDERLEAIVNRMFQRCLADKQFKQAVGIALETRRIDIFEKAILQADDVNSMLSYSLKVCMSLIGNRQFKKTVLQVLSKLYMGLQTPDYINVCQCFIFLDDPQSVADILERLIKGTEENLLMAYQIAFDLYDSATQQFLQRVTNSLRSTVPLPEPEKSVKTEEDKKDSEMEIDDSKTQATVATDATKATDTTTVKSEPQHPLSEEDKKIQERMKKLQTILGGDLTIGHNLQFLIRNNKTDMLILKNTKDAVRNSVCHSATVMANSFMHCGTTCDQFLRDNLEWLARATNWAKFTATASLGVIHKILVAYSEGGGLYELGLIHANHGGEITEYLLNQLKDASTDMVRHGGCLGLGLAAMGTARQDIYEQLKFNLYQDDAVTGEAAGLAMGLVMLGTKHANAIEDMLAYAKETQHEKILRGLAVGISLTMYERLEEADALIESYVVTKIQSSDASNQAIRKLLHVAVSDVNDDVRRIAVTSLGFLLFSQNVSDLDNQTFIRVNSQTETSNLSDLDNQTFTRVYSQTMTSDVSDLDNQTFIRVNSQTETSDVSDLDNQTFIRVNSQTMTSNLSDLDNQTFIRVNSQTMTSDVSDLDNQTFTRVNNQTMTSDLSDLDNQTFISVYSQTMTSDVSDLDNQTFIRVYSQTMTSDVSDLDNQTFTRVYSQTMTSDVSDLDNQTFIRVYSQTMTSDVSDLDNQTFIRVYSQTMTSDVSGLDNQTFIRVYSQTMTSDVSDLDNQTFIRVYSQTMTSDVSDLNNQTFITVYSQTMTSDVSDLDNQTFIRVNSQTMTSDVSDLDNQTFIRVYSQTMTSDVSDLDNQTFTRVYSQTMTSDVSDLDNQTFISVYSQTMTSDVSDLDNQTFTRV
ncbi:PSMD1 [Mytilus edulis]|uniref:PSMD1 n=1 Tax=Mytilus edulis TaxID=6550 RepID=A0A8S3UG90_MYTED|nr:PSMD1 [Mytilus edulis]